MALRKVETAPSGAGIEYWRVAKTLVNWVDLTAQVEILGYLNEEARRNNLEPLDIWTFNFEIMPIIGIPLTNVLEVGSIVYGMLKQQPRFAGAVDILEPGQTIIPVDPLDNTTPNEVASIVYYPEIKQEPIEEPIIEELPADYEDPDPQPHPDYPEIPIDDGEG